MQITDEAKTFTGELGTDLLVSSNHNNTHETPSVFVRVNDGFEIAAWATDDTEQVKEIIEHMAKMAGLDVVISKRFEPRYQPDDRVRSLMEDHRGQLGTVLHDNEHPNGWNVRVRLDGDTSTGLFLYDELEPVTKSSI